MENILNPHIIDMLTRFGFNCFFLTILTAFVVYPSQREREFAFTAVMMNITTFFICFTLKQLEMGIGTAIGLFAVFEILRYRTDTIRVKEMTYLFIIVGMAVINSFIDYTGGYAEIIIINSFIVGAALLKEVMVGNSPIKKKKKKKDNVDNGKDI